MAGDSNHSSSLGARQDTATHNLTAHESSSFLTTTELDSSETNDEDDEFITELTRQIEDYMLLEDDDDFNDNNTPLERFVSHNSISKAKNQNQSRHRVVVNSKLGRRWKITESTQLMKYSRGRGCPVASTGSGMRAVFLNRPGSKTGYNGTGVFLPPSANHPTAQTRKIPGCSAALVPTRVLEALQQHFNNLESLSPLNSLLHTQPAHQGQRNGMQQKSRWSTTSIDHVKKKLPREWTY